MISIFRFSVKHFRSVLSSQLLISYWLLTLLCLYFLLSIIRNYLSFISIFIIAFNFCMWLNFFGVFLICKYFSFLVILSILGKSSMSWCNLEKTLLFSICLSILSYKFLFYNFLLIRFRRIFCLWLLNLFLFFCLIITCISLFLTILLLLLLRLYFLLLNLW